MIWDNDISFEGLYKKVDEMINLCVEKYCHNCPEFKAHVTSYISSFGSEVEAHHDITCEYSDRCTQIKNI